MSRSLTVLALLAAGTAGPAVAQTSLFGQPVDPPQSLAPADPGPGGGAAAPERRKPKPKPRGPQPARSLTISNASSNVLTKLEVSGEGRTVALSKPVEPNGRATLRLPAFKKCVVAVSAAFGDEGSAESSDYNICREKSLRFTD